MDGERSTGFEQVRVDLRSRAASERRVGIDRLLRLAFGGKGAGEEYVDETGGLPPGGGRGEFCDER